MLFSFKRLESKLSPYFGLLFLLFLLVFLRLPNFSEPYWYGDEGIYLVIGTALRAGERLYAEIIDHKTPLIYYLAMTPTQFWFRLLLLGWMLVTTTAFYNFSTKLVSSKRAFLGTLLFILLTTFPWLEGNIPNGELFVMGFVLVGAALIAQTQFFEHYLKDEIVTTIRPQDRLLLLLTGGFLGLGILTKVPALFDAVGIMSLAWFSLTRRFEWRQLLKLKTWQVPLWVGVWIGLGLVIPLMLSIIYFVLRGSGQAYLDFGLLYNFRYAGSWNLGFTQAWLLWAFTLPGKTLIMGIGIGLITLARKWVSPAFQFIATWSLVALFASLLSNRPYPHYFLQLIPPLVLLAVVGIGRLKTPSHSLKNWFQTGIASFLIILTYLIMQLLNVGYYPTLGYYQRWFKLVTGQINQTEYYQSFNGIMADNYQAAAIIRRSPDPYLFIWGTNPMLYALTQKVPTGRFTVAFHVKDFNAYQETLDSLKAKNPTFIVVMNDDRQTFPEFSEYLSKSSYIPNGSFDHFTLWKRQ